MFRDGGLLLPTLLRPKSRGFIQLKTDNPLDQPYIQPNYLQHPEDIKTFVAGLKLGMKIADTEVFKNNNLSVIIERYHCNELEPFSDGYLECLARHWSTTVYHQSGTCKMGPKQDPMAVTNEELRIHGIKNLRVIDASMMPTIVGCNTNAPTIMIGEKGADMIIQSWTGARKPSSSSKDEL